MRSALWIGLIGLAATVVNASPPPPPDEEDVWSDALERAKPAIERCTAPATKAGAYGDVTVVYSATKREWKLTSTKSLGSEGKKLAACIRDAIAAQFKPTGRSGPFSDHLSHSERIGRAKPLLPAPNVMLPLWRKATAGDAAARGQLAKLLPPDYTLTPDTCLRTDSRWVYDAETLWLPTAGEWVPRLWEKVIPIAIGYAVSEAFWVRPGEFIVRGARGLCLVPFDTTKQAALRKQFDTVGSCWAGSFEDVLLHPRFAFPSDKRYVSIDASYTRACALTAAGELTCCGQHSPVLTALPTGVRSFALGGEWLCSLDKAGAASCTSGIDKPPAGTFTKLAVTYGHACGIEKSGTIACWGVNHNSAMSAPKGAFTDLVTDTFGSCGLRKGGSVECWGGERVNTRPRGTFTRLFGGDSQVCGLRKDGTVGCWYRDSRIVDTPSATRFRELAVSSKQSCGLRSDDHAECWSGVISPFELQTPKGAFAQLSGGRDMMCGVRKDGGAECWGDVWPTPWLADNTYPYAKFVAGAPAPPRPASVSVGSRVVDETGAPIAGAEVIVCNDYGPCVTVEDLARKSADSIADMIAAAQPAWDRAMYSFATTGSDGRWTATIAVPTASRSHELRAYAVAPGRELGQRVASFSDASKLGDFVLRPASSLDIDARCGKAACTGRLGVSHALYQGVEGTHLERLPPGSFTLEVTLDPGKPTERRATVNVDVDFTVRKLRRRVALIAVGGGNTIRGTARLVGAPAHDPASLQVTSRCRSKDSARDVYRSTKTDSTGAFVLTEVGEAPCKVEVKRRFGDSARRRDDEVYRASAEIGKLPAAGVKLEAREH